MALRNHLFKTFQSFVTLFGCGFLLLIGAGMFIFGVWGMVVGMHGGSIAAGIFSLFGAVLVFYAYCLGSVAIRSLEKTECGTGDENDELGN